MLLSVRWVGRTVSNPALIDSAHNVDYSITVFFTSTLKRSPNISCGKRDRADQTFMNRHENIYTYGSKVLIEQMLINRRH